MAANELTDNIVVFRIDPATRGMARPGREIIVDNPGLSSVRNRRSRITTGITIDPK
jgi:hypothetical protein